MTIEKPRAVLATDFDGTVCLTSEKDGSIQNVDNAYALAIGEHLGQEASGLFIASGGHNHRTPLEIVQALRPTLNMEESIRLAALVSGSKLDILVGQIGTRMANGERWPTPTAGFSRAWTSASESGKIATLVISAGHTPFINKWFGVFDLPPPGAMVTHEVTEGLGLQLPPTLQAKPSPLLMRVGLAALNNTCPRPLVYAGDDPIKDGAFAKNTGAEFVLVTTENARSAWRSAGELLSTEGAE